MRTHTEFSKALFDSDEFIQIPDSAKVLYVDLALNADDDGFISFELLQKVMKMTKTTDEDLRILIKKRYVIPYKNGAVIFLDKDIKIDTD